MGYPRTFQTLKNEKPARKPTSHNYNPTKSSTHSQDEEKVIINVTASLLRISTKASAKSCSRTPANCFPLPLYPISRKPRPTHCVGFSLSSTSTSASIRFTPALREVPRRSGKSRKELQKPSKSLSKRKGPKFLTKESSWSSSRFLISPVRRKTRLWPECSRNNGCKS